MEKKIKENEREGNGKKVKEDIKKKIINSCNNLNINFRYTCTSLYGFCGNKDFFFFQKQFLHFL